jgi:hypothetical protein
MAEKKEEGDLKQQKDNSDYHFMIKYTFLSRLSHGNIAM